MDAGSTPSRDRAGDDEGGRGTDAASTDNEDPTGTGAASIEACEEHRERVRGEMDCKSGIVDPMDGWGDGGLENISTSSFALAGPLNP